MANLDGEWILFWILSRLGNFAMTQKNCVYFSNFQPEATSRSSNFAPEQFEVSKSSPYFPRKVRMSKWQCAVFSQDLWKLYGLSFCPNTCTSGGTGMFFAQFCAWVFAFLLSVRRFPSSRFCLSGYSFSRGELPAWAVSG